MGHLPRLIVFDLDGTLIDSRRDLADAANALIVERGGSPLPEEAIARMVGEGAAVLVGRALDAAGLPMTADSLSRFLAVYDERLLRHTRPYAGIPEVLAVLAAESTLAVLTNKPLAATTRILEGLGLSGSFTSVLGGDGPMARKPDPASLRELMSRHGATPGQTALVGDSHIDLQTARAAGVHTCLARYGFGFDLVRPDMLRGDELLADSASDLPALLRRLS